MYTYLGGLQLGRGRPAAGHQGARPGKLLHIMMIIILIMITTVEQHVRHTYCI